MNLILNQSLISMTELDSEAMVLKCPYYEIPAMLRYFNTVNAESLFGLGPLLFLKVIKITIDKQCQKPGMSKIQTALG